MAKKKERNISWRKHWPNEFKTGRLSYEKPIYVQGRVYYKAEEVNNLLNQ